MVKFDPIENLVEDAISEEEIGEEQDQAALEESDVPEKPISLFAIFAGLLLALGVFIGLIFAQELINPQKSQANQPLAQATSTTKILSQLNSTQSLPNLSSDSWELVLVGPHHVAEEMTPELSEVSGILVDSRIAEATANFLAAAQTVDPTVHLILGYRSVVDQSSLYESFIAQEMEAQGITREGAISFVNAYFQAPGTSEHMTGLAIDMSTVDYVNQMDPAIAAQLAAIAPDYGFVLRYKESYQGKTGVAPEDWHFRYVGVEAARFMTDFDMPLETFLVQLQHQADQVKQASEEKTTTEARR
ncbi:M15 family metallopeptidase [Streptococcus merionis]|uniref:M15 family metallopeptidase n=1 Tax=Streptococcus merionis TaxID=400065 RepID=UPI0026F2DA1B|nr:M15 family metallopeptidase [Streptococcus merionis]